MKLLEKGRSLGDVIVGLITDKVVSEYKRMPYLNFEQRKKILINFKGVTKVISQNEWDYSKNIRKIQPDYFIHGDDWRKGHMSKIRSNVIKVMKKYGGKVIELPYTRGISSTALLENVNSISITADIRRGMLRRLINSKRTLRILEAHSPLSALVGENTQIEKKGKILSFDGFWSSSLTDSTVMGKPDNESLDFSQRLKNIDQIFETTTKPLIMDGDTGGKIEHFDMRVKSAERLGISALIIEDKKGLKKNSLLEDTSKQIQEDKLKFSEKIQIGKKAQVSSDFMIIARIESFILGKGIKDAISRAKSYVDAGADGIMIHSKSKSPKDIFEFAKKFRRIYKEIPLVAVPSSYNHVKENILKEKGFNIIIYANHMLRASYPSMQNVAKKILLNQRSKEASKDLLSINEILNLIPGTK
tara:strand:+ start:1836 stop:3083 length:1248 start_codon:yes stop_codon:yes gene_type:complete